MSTDTDIQTILDTTKVIALVGFSNNPDRPSYRVAKFLAERGYRVIPVNPGLAGQDFMGQTIAADLASIPKDAGVDMLDVFRRSEHVPPVVREALDVLPDLKTVWLQIGVTSEEAATMAADRGLAFVENLCPKQELEKRAG